MNPEEVATYRLVLSTPRAGSSITAISPTTEKFGTALLLNINGNMILLERELSNDFCSFGIHSK